MKMVSKKNNETIYWKNATPDSEERDDKMWYNTIHWKMHDK